RKPAQAARPPMTPDRPEPVARTATTQLIIGSPDDVGADLSPAASIDPMRIVDEGEIARGATSSVHRVRDLHARRRVAMKILDAGRSDPRVRARFLREAQIV